MSPRSRGTQAPRLGIQRALIAPGIAPQTPTPPSNMALQLQQLFGAAAGTAGAAAQFAGIQAQISGERKRARDIQKTREFAAAAEGTVAIPEFETKAVSDAFWQNQGHKTLATFDIATFPRLQGEDYAAAMHRWMDEHTDPTAPPIYHAVLMEGGRKQVAAQVIKDARQAQVTGLENLAENVVNTAVNAVTVDFDDAFVPFANAARAAGWSENEIFGKMALAGRIAAARGDVTRTDLIARWVGDVHKRPELVDGLVDAAKANRAKRLLDTIDEQIRTEEDLTPIRKEVSELADKDILPEAAARERLARINGIETAKLQETQRRNADALKLNILYKTKPDNELAEDIISRSVLPPTDPMHISANLAEISLNRITKRNIEDVREIAVRKVLASNGQLPPLTASHDTAIVKVLADGGTLDASGRILDPLRAATAFVQVGRVPGPVAEPLRAGMASETEARVQEAALSVGYLHVVSPRLATHLKDGMPKIAKLRTRYIQSRLNAKRPSVEEFGTNVAGYQAAMAARINEITMAAMRLTPVIFEPRQVPSIVWDVTIKHRDFAGKVQANARNYIRDNLPKNMRDTFRFGFGQDLIVPTHVVNEFKRLVNEEFEFAVSFGEDEAEAIETAQRWGLQETIQLHSPTLWDSIVRMSNSKNVPPLPGIEERLLLDIATLKLPKAEVEDLRNNHHWVWDDQQRGAIFVRNDNAAVPYEYSRNGVPTLLVINPFISTEEAEATDTAYDQRVMWEITARQKRNEPYTEAYKRRIESAVRHRFDRPQPQLGLETLEAFSRFPPFESIESE